ncbi:MAG: DUF4231 domain-containing protein [Shewanella sp.]|uniref:DUF4231 domain-containing protein n=1 Tax=Shewanella sp. TaxID=50422 RepID=UPI003562052D
MIKGFKDKSTHNKNESMLCFWLSMGGALAAPIFVTLGEDIAKLFGEYGSVFVFSKLVPTLLSVAVAFSTAWLQLRKPQQLWALYRTSQRELEDNLYKYQYRVAKYSDHPDPGKLLVENVAQIALNAHYSWVPMVPNPEDIRSAPQNTPKENE